MFMADINEDRPARISELLVYKRCQMVIGGQLKPRRIEGARWRQPWIHDHDDDDIVGFRYEARVSQICNVASGSLLLCV
jgi:hypothetical protein